MPSYKTKEELYAVVERTVAILQASQSLKAKSSQADVSVGFMVTDLGAEFCLRFSKGEVAGETGKSKDCSVGVSLSSATLDGIFSGKQDPEMAYTYGWLNLRGSEYVAEGLLRFWGELTAAYNAATQ
jgi:hypothetical protein